MICCSWVFLEEKQVLAVGRTHENQLLLDTIGLWNLHSTNEGNRGVNRGPVKACVAQECVSLFYVYFWERVHEWTMASVYLTDNECFS